MLSSLTFILTSHFFFLFLLWNWRGKKLVLKEKLYVIDIAPVH